MSMRNFLPVLFMMLSIVGAARAEDAKPVSLFDGKSLTGWTNGAGKPVAAGWVVEDGTLHRADRGGDIFTEKEYGDFELVFEWKISPGGNSGVKYRFSKYGNAMLGPEYQVLDDEKHPDGKDEDRRSASLYDVVEPSKEKALKPVGEWNHAKIVARGTHLEHWLNGKKVVDIDTAGDEWKQRVAKSKFKGVGDFGQNKSGRIMLQDHGNKVWYRNLTIRELSAAK